MYGGQVRRTAGRPAGADVGCDRVGRRHGDRRRAGTSPSPTCIPGIDGLFAVGKLLELLALQRTTLSQVIADLPPFHVATGHVDGAWETKGRVMRCLIAAVQQAAA